MAILAIKGHPTRGSEVIALLEMLGGVNTHNLYGDENYSHYTIDDNKEIIGSLPTDKFVSFTLERFLEKFPYKVGDKVWLHFENLTIRVTETITCMHWCNKYNCVLYDVSACYNLKEYAFTPYKEETMEEQKAIPSYMDYDVRTEESKELLIGFTKDNNGDWILNTHKDYEIKEENGTFKLIKKQPQYPKTYEECCEILKIEYPYFKTEEDGISASTYKNKLFGSVKTTSDSN